MCNDRNYTIIGGVAEIEAHDQVVEWFDELSQNEWERTLVVIDRLASPRVEGEDADLPKSG